MEQAALVCRFVLGFIFLLASISKLMAPVDFSRAVANYGLLPFWLGRLTALWLPRLELLVAGCLLAGLFLRPVAGVTAAMLLVFVSAAGINLARGRRIECGCGGFAAPRRIGPALLLRDLVLAGAAILVSVVPPAALAVPHLSSGTSSRALKATEALAIALTAAIVVALETALGEAWRLSLARRAFLRRLHP